MPKIINEQNWIYYGVTVHVEAVLKNKFDRIHIEGVVINHEYPVLRRTLPSKVEV
jgi:hypothetical protein